MSGILQAVMRDMISLGASNYILITTAGAGNAEGSTSAVSTSGDNYLIGYCTQGNGTGGICLIKLSPSGAIQWQNKLEATSGFKYGTDIALWESFNNIFVTGLSNGGIYCVAYGLSGNVVWQTYMAGSGLISNVIALDTINGGVYNTGTLDSGGGALIKCNYSTGTITWQNTITFSLGDVGFNGVCVGVSPYYVYPCGVVSYAYTTGDNGGLVCAFDRFGTFQWAKAFGLGLASNGYNTFFNGVTNDSSNNLYCVGQSNYNGNFSAIVAKYNSSGTLLWHHTLTGNPRGFAIALDGSNNVYIAGIGGASSNESFIVKYNNSGTIQWQRSLVLQVSPLYLVIRSIKIQNTSICVSGFYNASTFTPNSGSGLGFVNIQLPTDGTKTGTYTVGTKTFVYAASSYTDATPTARSYSPSLTTSAGTYVYNAGTLSSVTPTLPYSKTTL